MIVHEVDNSDIYSMLIQERGPGTQINFGLAVGIRFLQDDGLETLYHVLGTYLGKAKR